MEFLYTKYVHSCHQGLTVTKGNLPLSAFGNNHRLVYTYILNIWILYTCVLVYYMCIIRRLCKHIIHVCFTLYSCCQVGWTDTQCRWGQASKKPDRRSPHIAYMQNELIVFARHHVQLPWNITQCIN